MKSIQFRKMDSFGFCNGKLETIFKGPSVKGIEGLLEGNSQKSQIMIPTANLKIIHI